MEQARFMIPWARASLIIIVVLASAFLVRNAIVLTGHSFAQSTPQSFGPSGPGHRTYWLRGGPGSTSWNGSLLGPRLNASDGDTVTIMLQSVDGVTHSWFLDFNNNLQNDTNENPTVSPDFSSTSSWTNFTFTASLGTVIPHGGTFTYECRQHARFMNGNFKFFAGPVASFTHSPSTPLVGHPVSFNASDSWPSTDAMITNYAWDFGDGNVTSSGNNPTITHAYSTNATFSVRLTTTDSTSQTGQATSNVTILSPTGFDYNITLYCSGYYQNWACRVRVYLISGTPENVSLTTQVSSDVSQLALNVTSGFPTFYAQLSFVESTSSSVGCNMVAPGFSIVIIGLSSSGIARNAAIGPVILGPTLGACPYPYWIIGAVGLVIGITAVAVILIRRSRRKTRSPEPVRG